MEQCFLVEILLDNVIVFYRQLFYECLESVKDLQREVCSFMETTAQISLAGHTFQNMIERVWCQLQQI